MHFIIYAFAQVVTSCLYFVNKQLHSLTPEPNLSTWMVREAAAGSSTSQNSSPLVGETRAAGKMEPSLPSNTSCKEKFTMLQYNSKIT